MTVKQHQQIVKLLVNIRKDIKNMAEDQATFDAAMTAFIADLDTQLTNLNTAVQAIIDKGTAGGVDFSAEQAQLDAAKANIDQMVANLPSTPTPPPAGAKHKH